MRETTDTSPRFANEDIPDGPNQFQVISVEKFYGKVEFFIWKLKFMGGEGKQVLLPNMMAPLLRVLRCTETEPNKFDWDTDQQAGKSFKATVSHAPDKKDASKIRQHMTDFEAIQTDDIPF